MISRLMLGALTLVREEERGTWEGLISTPVSGFDAMLGKLTPYVLLGLGQAGIVWAISHWLFDLPIRGGLAPLGVAAALLAVAHLVYGICAVSVGAQASPGDSGRRFILRSLDPVVGTHVPFYGHAALGHVARRGSAAHSFHTGRSWRVAPRRGMEFCSVRKCGPMVVFTVLVSARQHGGNPRMSTAT
jgi:ABC-2 family transporter